MTDQTYAKSSAGFVAIFSSTALQRSVLMLALIAISGFALADDQKFNPCNVTAVEAAGLNGDLGTDVHALRNYSGTIARMLKEEKFDALDSLADQARAGKERFPGGAWETSHGVCRFVQHGSISSYPRHG